MRWFARNQRVIGRRNSEIFSLVAVHQLVRFAAATFSFCLPLFPSLAGCRFSRFPLRLRRGFFPRAHPLLSGAPFARSRFGFWLFRRGRLPLSRCFAFLPQLLLVQIPSKLLISKTAAQSGSSNCQCSCDLNRPAARCHVPRTFV